MQGLGLGVRFRVRFKVRAMVEPLKCRVRAMV